MAQRIVEEHGGVIDVVNLPEKGAAFTVRLPLKVDPAPGDGPRVTA